MSRFPRHRPTRAEKIETCGSTRELNGFIDAAEARSEVLTPDERAAEARCRATLAKKGL